MRSSHIYIGMGAVLTLLSGCDYLPKKTEYTVQPIRVEVETIRDETHVHTHTYVGTVEEESGVQLSIQTAGQVTSVSVRKGDHVEAGQELLRVDDTQARNALQVASATFRQAQDGYRRAQQVYAEGGITEQKMVELRSQLDQARSMQSMSRKSLDDCVLRAPVAGVVGDIRPRVGQTIAPGVPVVTLLDMEGYNVVFDVAEMDIASIQVGDSGLVRIAALGADSLPIRVVEKSLLPNTIAHTYTVKAIVGDLPEGYRGQLLPGMVGKVWLRSQSVSGYLVPADCIQARTNGTSLWIAQDGIAVRRNVEVGQYVAGGVVITRGLQEGDRVITSGCQKLYSGAEIRY